MYGEFEKIGENKYHYGKYLYTNSNLNFSCEFEYDYKNGNGVDIYFDDKQKLIEDTFYMDFEEYFNTKKSFIRKPIKLNKMWSGF